MNKTKLIIMFVALICLGMGGFFMMTGAGYGSEPGKHANGKIKLPEPKYESDTSVEKALLERRSVRRYKDEPLTLGEVSQLLWAAQGITDQRLGFKTAPSAGALYPLELYVLVGNVDGIARGVYKYVPRGHELLKVVDEDLRDSLAVAALRQSCVRDGAIDLVFTAVYERTTGKYGDRGIRYVHMEVGHAAENVCLQAVSLGLGTVVVGAFRDEEVKKVLSLPKEERPLCIMPIGRI